MFETFNSYADLFYIAFIKFDTKALKMGLFALFYIDELRRIVSETIIPKIIKFTKNENNLKIIRRKLSDDPTNNFDAYVKVTLISLYIIPLKSIRYNTYYMICYIINYEIKRILKNIVSIED